MSEFAGSKLKNQFTEAELAAFSLVATSIRDKGLEVSEKELILCTINGKLDVEKATSKYMKWLESLKEFGYTSFSDVWRDLDYGALAKQFRSYAQCGTDNEGRSVMWIRSGEPIQVADESAAIQAGCVFFAAIHSDYVSLRKGITFVIDTSANEMTKTVGNERKMQKSYQSYPLRPQKIFILGAGWIKRLVINALISFASLFTSEKVIERVRFADIAEVREGVTEANLPKYVGGGGGGGDDDIIKWVKARIDSFPAL
jgi:hypothetical protein